MSSEQIGCSLADAASSSAYTHFLKAASRSSPSLHVIYINTSLETKARTHELVPTITCTSSNVVATILQVVAFLVSILYFLVDLYYFPARSIIFISSCHASLSIYLLGICPNTRS
jgi:hypothetical protein